MNEFNEYDYEREADKEEMREKYKLGIEIQNEEVAKYAQEQAQKQQMEISDEVARELGFKNTADYNFHVNSNPEAIKAAQEMFAKVYKEGTKTVMSAATDVVRGRDAKGRFTKGTPHVEGEAQPSGRTPTRPAQPTQAADAMAAAKEKVNRGGKIRADEMTDLLEMIIGDL